MSNAAASSSSIIESPRQASPLPPKRGELGFREDAHGQAAEENSRAASAEVTNLPARHPADRDPPPGESAGDVSVQRTTTTTTTSSHDAATVTPKPSFLRPRKLPSYGGIHSTTLLLVIGQILVVGCTITAWVFSAKRISSDAYSNMQPAEVGVFVHIMFGVALLGQLILVERRIFRLRAERYAYLHPGEMLPTSRRLSSSSANMSLAPWHRPPLPTYAAALAASGHGTGDVEDHIIAAPPPPAYGNTRGSTLILSGFLRESLRAQRPLSTSSQTSWKSGRPVSYVSHEGQHDTHREARLEETLARLEEGSRRSDDPPSHC